MSASKDLIGMRFGKLIVKEKLSINYHREMEWLCICDCGNEYVSTSNRLTSGKTTQCRACSFKQMAKKQTIHGCEPIKLWRTYQNMKTRCNNMNSQDFKRYGERGIKICEEWNSNFAAFKKWALENGWKENLTLDRIDNSEGYSPDNCRWVTMTIQSNNRMSNRILFCDGENDTMANWSRKTGLPYWLIQTRLSKGWSEEKALKTPR